MIDAAHTVALVAFAAVWFVCLFVIVAQWIDGRLKTRAALARLGMCVVAAVVFWLTVPLVNFLTGLAA